MGAYRNLKTWCPSFMHWLTLASIIATATWFTFLSAPNQIFGHDYSSYQLLARAVGPHPGAPYLSYFDIKPPFLIYSVAGWISVFGTSSLSLYTMNILVISGCFVCLQMLIKKISNARLSYLSIMLMLLLTAATGYFKDMFFTSEALGLMYGLIALNLILKEGGSNTLRILSAGLFFGFSLQTKEVYVFLTLVGLGYLVMIDQSIRDKFKQVFVYLCGLSISQFIIMLFLALEGAANSYVEILRFKADNFPFPSLQVLLATFVDVNKYMYSQIYQN
jgi:hypothetical protein